MEFRIGGWLNESARHLSDLTIHCPIQWGSAVIAEATNRLRERRDIEFMFLCLADEASVGI